MEIKTQNYLKNANNIFYIIVANYKVIFVTLKVQDPPVETPAQSKEEECKLYLSNY